MDSRYASGFESLTTDEVEQTLIAAELEIARLRYIQTRLVREVDRRQVPLGDGSRTLVEWISSRLDVTPETARALGTVARTDSETLDTAMASGVAGFERVAEAAKTGEDDLAFHLDIGGLRRRAAFHRRVTRDEEIRNFGHRSLAYQRDIFGSVGRLWAEGPAFDTDAIFSAIEQASDSLPEAPSGHPEPRSARRFDGLHALCLGEADHTITTTVVVDATEAAGTSGESGVWVASGQRVGPAALEQILCESTVEVTARTEDCVPLAIGSSQKAIPGRTRRWVTARDGGVCTADGCSSAYRLQPHHIRHRVEGGRNEPDNLTSLCWYHHHVVIHGRGLVIDPESPPLRRRFRRPLHPPGREPPDY